MPVMKYINKILRINTLVKLRATGSPRELAGKLGISERRLYEYIRNMKELGAPIAFSYYHNSYIYYRDGELVITFTKDRIEMMESQEISGGGRVPAAQNPYPEYYLIHEKINMTAEILQYPGLDLNRFS